MSRGCLTEKYICCLSKPPLLRKMFQKMSGELKIPISFIRLLDFVGPKIHSYYALEINYSVNKSLGVKLVSTGSVVA